MSIYAKINSENIVENVIVADAAFISTQSGTWVEVTSSTGSTNSGNLYSPEHSKFIPHKPFDSWIFDEDSFDWVSPVGPKPPTGYWSWNESDQKWEELISELSE